MNPQQQPTPAPSVSSHTLSPTPASSSKPPLSSHLSAHTYPQKPAFPQHPYSQRQLSPHQQHPTQPRNPLHPSILPLLSPEFVDLHNSTIQYWSPPPTDLQTIRANYSSLYRFATRTATGVGGIGETQVPGWPKYPGEINVRVYVPPGEEGERRVWPVHFNFHGGGWAVGDLETSAHICHHICASVPCCVIDIEYRLIPEYPFPIGIMDGLSAVAHILANHKTFSIDSASFTLGGESSGGTIALILNHILRDGGMGDRVKGVIAGTPTISDVRKYATPDMSPWPSMQESQHTPLLSWEKLKWFDTFKWMSLSTSHPGVSAREAKKDVGWFADAMNAPNFKDLAPMTWVGTAECDPLRDEAEAYAEKVRAAGNKVITRRFEGMPHGFVHMDGILRQGREYVEDVINVVRDCLYKKEEEVKEEKNENEESEEKKGEKQDEAMSDATI